MVILAHPNFRSIILFFVVLLLCNLASSQPVGKFPDYKVRVKEPTICDGAVKQHSGYFDIDDKKHFFFWAFESRNKPLEDPVVLWLHGGPGCSALNALFFELGPCKVNKGGNSTSENSNSWNSNATIIFLDQPDDAGFSYGEGVSDTASAAFDIYVFTQIFFTQFSQYANLSFHIAGVSYGGHYIPTLASLIMKYNNDNSNAMKLTNINLKSILIGNGLVNPLLQFVHFPDMACPLLDPLSCNQMKNNTQQCSDLTQTCYNTKNAKDCVFAKTDCFNTLIEPIEDASLNILDLRQQCSGILCYPDFGDIAIYLSRDDVRNALGVDPSVAFQLCSININNNFIMSGDWMLPFDGFIPSLLNSNIRTLVYAGDKDYLCNWIGNKAWTKALVWSGSQGFNNANDSAWITNNGNHSGDVTTFGVLSFLRVFDAGHMVPHDKPAESLDFFNKWIFNKHL
ncbi:9497_t:CDS:2 [Cetraspora pellucida]|uniref:carboxypeptidase C n=1 Tax=Cetraspora pellucida TaxID=1433469 RepID=A0A9N8Z5S1_9GLOM|nr:9497_t:CDS:2 [Cetraspora pellucida]